MECYHLSLAGELRPVAAKRCFHISLATVLVYDLVAAVFALALRSYWGVIFTSDATVQLIVAQWLPLVLTVWALLTLQVGNAPARYRSIVFHA
jgi:hypothetical protein